MTARLIIADVFEGLRSLSDASVDLVLTSPPFLALRSYLPADHALKSQEIGSEPTPADFIDTLLDVAEECARVLAPHGSLCFELGDTYSGSGGGGGDYAAGGFHDGQPVFDGSGARERLGRPDDPRQPRSGRSDAWPSDKSLCLIPESFRWALAYGRNPFNGRQTEPWRVRNVVRWCRPNPPVGALGDKVRPATSDIVVACKSRTRWFDLDAVRHDPLNGLNPDTPMSNGLYRGHPAGERTGYPDRVANPAGAPPLDHWWYDDVFDQDAWLISTQPFKGSHYATFPEELCVKPILSMCPEKVCRVCGEPSRRIVEGSYIGAKSGTPYEPHVWASGIADRGAHSNKLPDEGARRVNTTLGWTDCGHANFRPGVTLDPFAGSGTTGQVATRLGRDAVLIELDPRNEALIRERIGLFMGEVVHLEKNATEAG